MLIDKDRVEENFMFTAEGFSTSTRVYYNCQIFKNKLNKFRWLAFLKDVIFPLCQFKNIFGR